MENQALKQRTSSVPPSSKIPLGMREHIDKIGTALGTGRDSMLAVALACAAAVAEFGEKREQSILCKSLPVPFTPSKLSKYVAVGRAKWMHDPKHRDRVPHEYSVAYYLARLGETAAVKLLSEGKIHPALSRKDAEALSGGDTQAVSPSASRVALSDFYAVIKIPKPMKQSAFGNLNAILDNVKMMAGVELLHPWEPLMEAFQKEQAAREQRVEKTLCSLAKQLVKETIARQHRQTAPQMKLKKFRERCGWYDDTIALDANSDEERVREVLSVVGVEDQFHELRKKADLTVLPVEMPECAGYPELQSDEAPALRGKPRLKEADVKLLKFERKELPPKAKIKARTDGRRKAASPPQGRRKRRGRVA